MFSNKVTTEIYKLYIFCYASVSKQSGYFWTFFDTQIT